MKVVVEFTNEQKTRARVLLIPSWLGRLFGASARSGDVEKNHVRDWRWTATNRLVGDRVTRELEAPTVAVLPPARVRRGAHIENCTAGGDIIAINRGRDVR